MPLIADDGGSDVVDDSVTDDDGDYIAENEGNKDIQVGTPV